MHIDNIIIRSAQIGMTLLTLGTAVTIDTPLSLCYHTPMMYSQVTLSAAAAAASQTLGLDCCAA